MKRYPLLLLCLFTPFALAAADDPRLSLWQTGKSAQYARIYETTSGKTAGTTVTVWPSAGLTNGGGGVSTASYSDVQRVAYSANYVYIQTTGLASYTMGNWLTPNGFTYTSWPANRAAIHRIPRTPTIPTTKQKNNGSGGVLVNGVFVWQNGDAQSYANASSTTSTATISMGGDGIWNRLAGVAETFNFDVGNAHQPGSGAYHNHINPKALRYQLGDAVTYNSSTKVYSEGTPTKHSPIIGWANDGLPIYGPYGYATATDATSAIRRMTTGFQKRDGTNGTVNLATTGRTTLPVWAASVQSKSQTLASGQYGPTATATYALGPVNMTCSIGTFAEDYEYLGDVGKTQGTDFDLNRQNVRYCVTPEFPGGTYAYFTCIDASGNSVFPDVINQEYFGTAAAGPGTVTSITETVTDYVTGGPAATIIGASAASGANTVLTWNSAEGATSKVESSATNSTWTTLSATVTSGGVATSYTATGSAGFYRITLTALASYDAGGTYGTPVGTTATVINAGAATAPSITTPPSGATVAVGASVTFSVAASGTAPLSYQWTKGTTSISGATNASYTIAAVALTDAGSYRVTVSNTAGAVTSDPVTLTVNSTTTADARLASWFATPSVKHARLYETDAAKAAGTTVTTWSRGSGVQATPSYAGVMQVSSSTSWVYLRASGLGYHVMGPWYLNAGHTQNFPNFPANQNVLYRIPRTPSVPTTKTLTPGGAIGYGVDGVALFDNRDTFSYSTTAGQDAEPVNGLQGGGVWNRDAYVNEGVTFDPAFAHQAGSNYHYHANTPALRYLLGDHVDYSASTKAYTESTTAVTKHSPILGWMADGHPVYGPHGYGAAADATSGVRRMIAGYVKRDGANGTTNLAATGRTTLPAWAATAQNRSATLASTAYGPAVNTTYTLGRYLEDYDYLGQLGKTQGADFDLDLYNGRFCVTPEFPGGTYAYFISVETDGTPKFPYIIGRWFYGSPTGGAVTSIAETVTEYVRAGPTTALALSAVAAGSGVLLTWNSVEGATYKVESSSDHATWAPVAAAVTSAGATTVYSASAMAGYFRVTLTAIASYDARAVVGTPVGTTATVTFTATSAPTLTAQPTAAAASSGGGATFAVTAGGTGPFAYQWLRNGQSITGATAAMLTLATVQVPDAGLYSVVVTNGGGSVTSAAAELTVATATHAVVGSGYIAGGTVTLTQTATFTGTPARIAWQLLLPTGWTVASSTATGTLVAPAAGTASLAEWVWTTVPASPVTFSCTLNVPAAASGVVSLSAILVGKRADDSTFQVLAAPEPLVVTAASPWHSADSDRDGRIGLFELTRVIELYNARNGTVRTGAYHVQAGSEDGFAAGP